MLLSSNGQHSLPASYTSGFSMLYMGRSIFHLCCVVPRQCGESCNTHRAFRYVMVVGRQRRAAVLLGNGQVVLAQH